MKNVSRERGEPAESGIVKLQCDIFGLCLTGAYAPPATLSPLNTIGAVNALHMYYKLHILA